MVIEALNNYKIPSLETLNNKMANIGIFVKLNSFKQ